jgi:hypothetical protein
MVTTLLAEGWCTDPWGIHEARWLSAGVPTALVRDGGIEARDPAPAGVPPRPAELVSWGAQGAHGADLLRSDRPQRTPAEDAAHLCSMMLRSGAD